MGANVAASSAEKKALSKGAKTPPQKPSFEDVLNAIGDKKPKATAALKKPKAKDVGPKSEGSIDLPGGGPIGLASGVLEGVVQKVAEENQKKKEITKALKEMKSKKNQDKYEASIKQAALEKLGAAQQTPAKETSSSVSSTIEPKKTETPKSTKDPYGDALKAYQLKQLEQQANKQKYSSYSPFALFGQQYSNPYEVLILPLHCLVSSTRILMKLPSQLLIIKLRLMPMEKLLKRTNWNSYWQ